MLTWKEVINFSIKGNPILNKHIEKLKLIGRDN